MRHIRMSNLKTGCCASDEHIHSKDQVHGRSQLPPRHFTDVSEAGSLSCTGCGPSYDTRQVRESRLMRARRVKHAVVERFRQELQAEEDRRTSGQAAPDPASDMTETLLDRLRPITGRRWMHSRRSELEEVVGTGPYRLPSRDQRLTPEDVAHMERVKPATVREWLRRGKLAGQRNGRGWRVTWEAYDRFIGMPR
jgi:hypothetical protein